jgi:hypothetical protein
VIGQSPRYALATPVFRFRALAALSGPATQGGDRETQQAFIKNSRLSALNHPPYDISLDEKQEQTENTRQWLSALAVPSGIRSTAFGIFGALTGFDRARLADAFLDLVKAASGQLDEASRAELNALLHELSASQTAGHVRHTVTQSQPS